MQRSRDQCRDVSGNIGLEDAARAALEPWPALCDHPAMIRSILVTLGVLALIAWTALGAAAWWSVQSKVHVTIADDEASHGVSEITLLRDAVNSLHGDLAALRRSGGL